MIRITTTYRYGEISARATVRCERCQLVGEWDEAVPRKYLKIYRLISILRRGGWLVGKEVLCSDCRKQKKK